MEKLIFKPRATFTHDLNYLSKVNSTIVNEVHSAIDYLCERGKLANEFDDHKLHGIYEGYSEFHIRDTPKGMKTTEKNDVILIYKIRYHELTVIGVRVGSHPKLFSGRYSKPKK